MSSHLTLISLLFVYMNILFLVSLIKKRNDVADTGWGLGFVLLTWASFFLGHTLGIRSLLVSLLVSIWGIRLAWHIYTRNKGKTEDYRYFAWRKEWGKWFYLRSYFQIYMLQGFFLLLIVIPVLLINQNTSPRLGLLDFGGIAIWLFGFCFEVVGDTQLALFIKNPANTGKIIQSGLWAYTRHPNYFGEVTQWWGIWILALSVPYGWISIIGPLTITVLILKISGIPMLEKKMAKNPDFDAYKQKVSIFIPMFPKR